MPAPLVLLTRPRAASLATAARLQRAGVDAACLLVAPLMETEPTEADWSPDDWTGFVFTSAEGVRYAALAHDLRRRRAWCVGDRTAEAAAAAGMEAESAGGAAEDLVALISRQCALGPLLHLCGAETRGNLAEALSRAGTDTTALVLYRQISVPLDPAAARRVGEAARIVAPAYSPLSAERLQSALAPHAAQVHLIAMSTASAAAWTGPTPGRTTILPSPDGAAMERAIIAALRVEARRTES
jgi:uroporphyrinogen-III synthase